jgi:chromosome segregation ATPase
VASEDEQNGGGTAALVAAGALDTRLARELGATQEDVAATEQELTDAQKQTDAADQEAAAAKRLADDATDKAEKADAQANQANAERDAAQAKARIAAECGKAYISAFGDLFGSGNLREQVPAVQKDLEGITADCKSAFAGT